MPTTRLLAPFSCFLLLAPIHAEDQIPTKARVGAAGADVYDRPDEGAYATDRLPAGESVDIWRREPQGWLAIKPPSSSFSLVVSSSVRRRPDSDVAEVTSGEIESWVGSNLSRAVKYRSQITLEKGEQLVVLGEERVRLREGSAVESVLRVLPPSGEFRWIREQDLATSSPRRSAANDDRVQHAQHQQEVQIASPAVRSSQDQFVARKGSASKKGESSGTANAAGNAPTDRRPGGVPRDFESALKDLEVQLSLIVARPVETWELSELRKAAERMVDSSASASQRARVERYLEQVEEFEGLRRRSGVLEVPGSPRGEARAAEPTERPGGGEGTPALDPRFDGTGWLLPVHSTKRAAPPYALLDREGRILQFVSPAPGLNLHRYLRKEIGVYGERSYSQALDKPLVTAHRVVELGRQKR